MDIEKYIKTVPDFPKKGILFYDITPLIATPKAYSAAIDALAEKVAAAKPEAIMSPEARGFMFGIPVALKLGLPFFPVRKRGRLPRKTLEVQYNLEYGTDSLCVHDEDIAPNLKIAVVDDILATGGTAAAMRKMAEIKSASVACYAFFMELEFLKGRKALEPVEVISILRR